MKTITLRKLSLKSIIGFGRYADLVVQDVINLSREDELIRMYYNLEKISFLDEVLSMLGITEKLRIEKPGKSPSFYQKNKKEIYDNLRSNNNEQMCRMSVKMRYWDNKGNLSRKKKAFSRLETKHRDVLRNQHKKA